jgi:hypothetical protein
MNLKKNLWKKKLGISMKKTHIKYGKETYLGRKKNIDGRNTCLKTKKKFYFC